MSKKIHAIIDHILENRSFFVELPEIEEIELKPNCIQTKRDHYLFECNIFPSKEIIEKDISGNGKNEILALFYEIEIILQKILPNVYVQASHNISPKKMNLKNGTSYFSYFFEFHSNFERNEKKENKSSFSFLHSTPLFEDFKGFESFLTKTKIYDHADFQNSMILYRGIDYPFKHNTHKVSKDMFYELIDNWYECPNYFHEKEEIMKGTQFLFYDGENKTSFYFKPMKEPYKVLHFTEDGQYIQTYFSPYRILLVKDNGHIALEEYSYLAPELTILDLVYCTTKYELLMNSIKDLYRKKCITITDVFPNFDLEKEYIIVPMSQNNYKIYAVEHKKHLKKNLDLNDEYLYTCISPAAHDLSIEDSQYTTLFQHQSYNHEEEKIQLHVRHFKKAANKRDYLVLDKKIIQK